MADAAPALPSPALPFPAPAADPAQTVLEVRDLVVEFPTRHGTLRALDGVSLTIAPGEVLGVVGESGAGESMTGLAVQQLLEPPGRIAGGRVMLDGRRIDNLPERDMTRIRGRVIGAIFQDPLTSLNPLFTIGQQLTETIRLHLPLSRVQARARAIDLLAEVGIPAPSERVDSYPHQFSGGMRQRVVIALALAARPRLVIADEPTSALDVSIQAQITALLRRLCKEHGTAVMLVTHDMGVIAETADRVAVMYAGRLVEIGPVAEVVPPRPSLHARADGQHPGAWRAGGTAGPDRRGHAAAVGHPGRLRVQSPLPAGRAALPRRGAAARPGRRRARRLPPARRRCRMTPTAPVPGQSAERTDPTGPALTATNLTRTFDVSDPWLNRVIERKPRRLLRAVDGIDFSVPRGRCLSLVGESGCGKSTVARLVTGLHAPTDGRLRFAAGRDGQPLSAQMIFQDPYASLNPRWRVADIVAEPLRELQLRRDAAAIRARVDELLTTVGLSASDGSKYPHEFSGGSASASRSPAPWPESPSSSSATSRPARSMSACRRRSST